MTSAASVREEAAAFKADELAEFIGASTYADLPDDVVSLAKVAMLDGIGCMLGGSTVKPGKAVLDFVRTSGPGNATVMGGRQQAQPLWASYANAQLGNMLDYDDTWSGLGHPGAPVIAAAMAVGEDRAMSGEDLLDAVVVGYEVATRVADYLRPTPERINRVWGQGTIIIFGAAVAAAKLQRQSTRQLAHTLGLAGVHAPVPSVRKFGYTARPLSWIKNNFGWTAMGGVMSATLVSKNGFTGNRSIFDGDEGFWIMSSSDRCDPDALTRGFGSHYQIRKLSFKPYTTCRFIHTTLDACFGLLDEVAEIQQDEIQRITVRGAKKLLHYDDRRPGGVIDIQFSIPYALALACSGVPVGLAWLDERHLTDPRLHSLADLVEFEHEPSAEEYYREMKLVSTVEIELRNGNRFAKTFDTPLGDPTRPMSQARLEAKFLDLAAAAVGSEQAQELLSRVLSLENEPDIRRVLRLCQPTGM